MMTDQETNEAVAKVLMLSRSRDYQDNFLEYRSGHDPFRPCGDEPENVAAAMFALERISDQTGIGYTISKLLYGKRRVYMCSAGGHVADSEVSRERAICDAILRSSAKAQPAETAVAG